MRTIGPDPTFDAYPSRTWQPPAAAVQARRGPFIHVVLFVLTFITTAMAGAFEAGANPLADVLSIRAGFPFAVTLLTILLVHEFGHYGLARLHGVRATLPYFIPAPPIFIGTFGAFIRMQSPPPNRRALFDVGAAGPWAGLIASIPAILIGLRLSEVRPMGLEEGGLVLGDSILFSWLSRLAIGTTPDNVTIVLHPVALAGWFGLFVTMLNLLPIGQLDGGHVSYAMFGRIHGWIARAFMAIVAALALTGWPGWMVWVILPLVIGVDHPPTRDVATPLDFRRRVGGWLTIGAFVVTFMAEPFAVSKPAPQFQGDRTPVAWDGSQPTPRGGLVVPFRHPSRAPGIAL